MDTIKKLLLRYNPFVRIEANERRIADLESDLASAISGLESRIEELSEKIGKS